MPIPPTFPVEVPDLGTFTFRKRTIELQVRIQTKAIEITGGRVDDPELKDISAAIATLKVLLVGGPDGWTTDSLDPFDREVSAQLWKVFGALRVAEDRFRGGAEAQPPRMGDGAG